MEPKKALTLLFFGQIAALIYTKLILLLHLKLMVQGFGSDRFNQGFMEVLFRDYWFFIGLVFLAVFYFSLKAVVDRGCDWKDSIGIYAVSLFLTFGTISVAMMCTSKHLSMDNELSTSQ